MIAREEKISGFYWPWSDNKKGGGEDKPPEPLKKKISSKEKIDDKNMNF